MVDDCAGRGLLAARGLPLPGYTRIIQRIYPNQIRGKMMSISRMGRVTAILVLTPLAGWALDQWGYRVLFPAGKFAGDRRRLYLYAYPRARRSTAAAPTRTFSDLRQILREDRRFSYYLTSYAIFGTGTIMSWTLYPLVQVDRLHLSYSQLGWLGLIQSIFWLGGFWMWGQLVDRPGGLFVVRATAAVAIFLPISYIFAQNMWMLLPAFAIQGLVNAGFDMEP